MLPNSRLGRRERHGMSPMKNGVISCGARCSHTTRGVEICSVRSSVQRRRASAMAQTTSHAADGRVGANCGLARKSCRRVDAIARAGDAHSTPPRSNDIDRRRCDADTGRAGCLGGGMQGRAPGTAIGRDTPTAPRYHARFGRAGGRAKAFQRPRHVDRTS